MNTPNFICPKTNEEFFIPKFIIIPKGSKTIYRENNIKGKELVNPDNGEKLIPIARKGPIEAPLVIGSTQDRMARNQTYFKQRAKKHAQSDEQQYLKKKATDREMKKFKS